MSIFPTSQRQIEANRANAQHSTGPRTEAGKAKVSRNATSHGIFSRTLIFRGEDPLALAALSESVIRRMNPRDHLELSLAQEVISSCWRMQRLRAAEQQIHFGHCTPERQGIVDDCQADLDAANENLESAKADCIARIRNADEKRRDAQAAVEEAERELESAVTPSGAEALADMLDSDSAPLDRISRYERQLSNSFHRALKMHEHLQKQPPPDELCEFAAEALESIPFDAEPAPAIEPETEDDNSKPNQSEVQEEPAVADSDPAGESALKTAQPAGVPANQPSSTPIVQNEVQKESSTAADAPVCVSV